MMIRTAENRSGINDLRKRCFERAGVLENPQTATESFSTEIDSIIAETFTGIDTGGKISIIALGGYGRRELCPWSDVDIMVLHDQAGPGAVGALVRAFWDMGLTLGCVVRTLAECRKIMGEDLATDTAMLESRFVCGSVTLFREFRNRIVRPYFRRRHGSFSAEMIGAIREILFANNAMYVVAPDLKNGICTLRDCRRIIWAETAIRFSNSMLHGDELLPFTKEEYLRFHECYSFLLRMRILLHLEAGRRLDVLEVHLQPRIAENMGYGLDGAGKLMEYFFRTIRDLRHCLLRYIELRSGGSNVVQKIRRTITAVPVAPGLKVLDGIVFRSGPLDMSPERSPSRIMHLFEIALEYQAALSVGLINCIRSRVCTMSENDIRTTGVFESLRTLLSSEGRVGMILSIMHDTGFLGACIPEFEALACKVEYDSYHEFTVDQHILVALELLDHVNERQDAFTCSIFANVKNLYLLRLAVLLHDIGKSLPEEHAVKGAVIAGQICERFGLSEEEEQRIVLLIRMHLEFSKLAFRREPEEHLIKAFASELGDRENLDLLYMLTVLDIQSVGPKTWTVWKGLELQAVYRRTAAVFDSGREVRAKDGYEQHEMPEYVFNIKESVKGPGDFRIESESFIGFDRISVCAFDRPRLFADIVGCISSEGYNILNAKITTSDDGKVFDIFNCESDRTTSLPTSERIGNLRRKFDRITSRTADTAMLIEERLRRYPPKFRRGVMQAGCVSVRIDNTISEKHTVIEVEVPDRFGLLYIVACLFARFEVNIVSAKLSTRIARAVDVFYVNRNGVKLQDQKCNLELQNALRSELG